MKKLFGFTLAEVLVTMGIIGVVAALTTPVLVTNVNRQGYATALKATVNDLENAFTSAIGAEQTDSIYGTTMWLQPNNAGFINELQTYLKCRNARVLDYNQGYQSLGNDGKPSNGAIAPSASVLSRDNYALFNLTNGATVFISKREPDAGGRFGAALVRIDVNGTASRPNTIGLDVFRFYLSSDGELIASGSRKAADNIAGEVYWNTNAGCTDGHLSNNNGFYCAGRVVERGYKIEY